MTIWEEFGEAAPTLARLGKGRFDRTDLALVPHFARTATRASVRLSLFLSRDTWSLAC